MTAILDLDPSMDGRPALYGATRYADYRFAKRPDAAPLAGAVPGRAQARGRSSPSGSTRRTRACPTSGARRRARDKNRRATRARIHVKAADRLVQRLEAAGRRGARCRRSCSRSPTCPSLPPEPRPGPLLELRAPLRRRGRLDLRRACASTCRRAGACWSPGPNGSGKSTLLAALAGTRRGSTAASRTLAPGVRLGRARPGGPDRARRGRVAHPRAPGAERCPGSTPTPATR